METEADTALTAGKLLAPARPTTAELRPWSHRASEAQHADLTGNACGAPLLASAGAGMDALRVSPDIGHVYLPPGGDMSQPSGKAAIMTGQARSFFHGAWFRADLDCILAHPATEHREQIAEHIASVPGGLRVSGDRLPELDDHGLEITRRLLLDQDAAG